MKAICFSLVISFFSILFFASCNKEQTATPPALTRIQVLSVPFSTQGSHTFFSFKDSTQVTPADSASGKWDFAIRFARIIVNSQASGPGNAGVIMKDGIFSDIDSAPTTGYAYDTTQTRLAISDASWYDYNPRTHAFIPKAGRVFVFRTANGVNYAKMQFLSVDYAPFTGRVPTTLLYKFEYTYQPGIGNSFQ
jgi:hypothetical protein